MISSFLHFFSSPTSTDDTRIHRRSFVANLILLLGCILGVWFQIYEFNSRDRERIAITVYFLAFSLLVISGIVELSVDLFSIRTVGHGRYHSGSSFWNRVISVLFITMGITDIMAFCYWMIKDFRTENILQICSGYVLLIMSILVLFFQMKESIGSTPDRIDLFANWLVYVDAILNVVLRHVELSVKFLDDETNRIELAVVILLLITAVLYVSADVIRIKSSGGGGTQQPNSAQKPPTQQTDVCY